ncbi:MAG TPA: cytochrome C oxidase subunit I [Candidatus Kapabacteria bacterium]|nr:cytochrome C oxidase subunit I [Candidatus Kapabacteria bacterium]
MFPNVSNTGSIKTTSYKVVLPFYLYAALSFLVATIMLFISNDAFLSHYFHPHILAITHAMALGWGTMVILGAGHQLVPVLIEGKLYSEKLAYSAFILAAVGIPLLVYGFYTFNMNAPAKWGGRLIVFAVISFLVNIAMSIKHSKGENVHSVFIFTSTIWLLITTLFGLVLVYNFTYDLMPNDSLHYLPLHAHAGMIGWFLLLVIGVGSRLIPLFLISKYTNPKLLWIILLLINGALLLYFTIFYFFQHDGATFIPTSLVLIAVALFIYYCYMAYAKRLRRQVDEQVKISLLSVFMLLLPVILLFTIITLLMNTADEQVNLILTYGFVIFFGWITAIILGMTFKTLPFIAWNKAYRNRSAMSKTPSPKDLFDNNIFKLMGIAYLFGFTSLTIGILFSLQFLLQIGSILLIITAIFYNWNVIKVINHKAIIK